MKSIPRKLFFLCLLVLLAYFNIKLLHKPNIEQQENGYFNNDVYKQLNHLKHEISNGADEKMQQLFPEGYFFLNVLYGLTWCELAETMNKNSPEYEIARTEAIYAFEKLKGEAAYSIFPANINPSRGIFYNGWKNYLLAKMVIAGFEDEHQSLKLEFEAETEKLVVAYQRSDQFYLESYEAMTWPADNLLAIASISIFNQLNQSVYHDFLENWKDDLQVNLDEFGLIPHSTIAGTGAVQRHSRGSSQSLILVCLKEIDEEIAFDHFQKFRANFLARRIGLPGIREYPRGKKGIADADSGPVIFGIGGSGSIVSIKTFNIYADHNISSGLRNSVEAFGFPYKSKTKKKYLLGKMPMADAFIAWANVSYDPGDKSKAIPFKENWKLKFLVPSFAIMLLLIKGVVTKTKIKSDILVQ